VIWKAIEAADVKALKLASEGYDACAHDVPYAVMQANIELLDKKNHEFERAVIQEYKLTDRQVSDLYAEGSQKHWPQIDYNPPGC
jgi:hypothetical protein